MRKIHQKLGKTIWASLVCSLTLVSFESQAQTQSCADKLKDDVNFVRDFISCAKELASKNADLNKRLDSLKYPTAEEMKAIAHDEFKSTPFMRGWTSHPFRLALKEAKDLSHSLDETPAIVQIWSSVSQNGPWELVDGIYNDGNMKVYGAWITGVTKNNISVWAGDVSVTSSYGGNSDHWTLYHNGEATYKRDRVWFRLTAIAQTPPK